MTSVSQPHPSGSNGDRQRRRRNVIRTALLLGAVVLVIYLIFIGQGIWSHFTS